MKQSLLALTAALLSTCLVASCTPSSKFRNRTGFTPEGEVDKATLSYQLVHDRVIGPRCVTCHQPGDARGRTTLHDYASVKAKIERVRIRVLREGTMPEDRRLTRDEENILRAWIESGAPEKAQDPNESPSPSASASPTPAQSPVPSPEPTPAPSPIPGATPGPSPIEVLPTFQSIRQLFERRCFECHTPGGSAEDVLISPVSALTGGSNPLVLVGNPDASPLVQSIERRGGILPMPPNRRPPPLSAQEINAIKTWISRGARD